MNKNDLVSNVSKKTGVSRDLVKSVVDSTIETMAAELKFEGGEIRFKNFFVIYNKTLGATKRRNINDGSIYTLPQRPVLRIKAMTLLNKRMNETIV